VPGAGGPINPNLPTSSRSNRNGVIPIGV